MAFPDSALRRPCDLWHTEDDIGFKVCESIHLLSVAGKHYDFFETVGVVDHARRVRDQAVARMDLVQAEDLRKLQKALDYSLPNVRKGLEPSLEAAWIRTPPNPVTRETLHSWHQSVSAYLDFFLGLAPDLTREKRWADVYGAAENIYNSYMEQLAQDGEHVPDAVPRNEESKTPSYPPSSVSLTFLNEHAYYQSSPETVRRLCKGMTNGLRYWCSLAESANVDELFRFLHHFKIATETVFADSAKRLPEDATDMIPRRVRILYQGWCRIFARSFGDLLRDNLAYRYEDLVFHSRNQMNAHNLELEFTTLATDLDAIMISKPARASWSYWVPWDPSFGGEIPWRTAINEVQTRYAEYQAQTYGDNEFKRLWLLVWHCLKLTNRQMAEGLALPLPACTMETSFFRNPFVQGMFDCIRRGSDVLNSLTAENIVAEYCIFFARAVKDSDDRMFAHYVGTTEVNDHLQQVMNLYTIDQRWHAGVIHAMREAAARLNHLTQGPAYVRRALQATPVWYIDRPTTEYVNSPSARGGDLDGHDPHTSGSAMAKREKRLEQIVNDEHQRGVVTRMLMSIGKGLSRWFRISSRRGPRKKSSRDQHPARRPRYYFRLRERLTEVEKNRITKPGHNLRFQRRSKPVHDANSRVHSTSSSSDGGHTSNPDDDGGPNQSSDLTDDQQLIVTLLEARLNGFWPRPGPPRSVDWIISQYLVPHGWHLDEAFQAIRQYLESRITSRFPRVRLSSTSASSAVVPQSQHSDSAQRPSVDDIEIRRSTGEHGVQQPTAVENGHGEGSQPPRRWRSAPPGGGPIVNEPSSMPTESEPQRPLPERRSPDAGAPVLQIHEDSAGPSQVSSERQDSDIENILRPAQLPKETSPIPDDDRPVSPGFPGCGAHQCHRCPVYPGEIHHVCPIVTRTVAGGNQMDEQDLVLGPSQVGGPEDGEQTNPSVSGFVPVRLDSASTSPLSSLGTTPSYEAASPADRTSVREGVVSLRGGHGRPQQPAVRRTMVTRAMVRAQASAQK